MTPPLAGTVGGPSRRKARPRKRLKMPAMTAAALRRQATGEAALEDLKPRKFKPGTRAVMEIRKMQRTAGLLLRRAPFARLCKEASQLFAPDFRFRVDAIAGLQTAAEAYLVNLFQDACLCAIHAKRCTIYTRDFHLAERIRGHTQPWEVSGVDGAVPATRRTMNGLLPQR